MAHIEGFPDVAVGALDGNSFIYVRQSAEVAGSRDKRFSLPAALRSFMGLSVVADTLPYGSGTGALALTTFTALARTLLAQATAPLMRVNMGILTATAALDFGSISSAASADLTITVPGAATGDAVMIGLPAAPAAGIVFFGFVSTANTVTIRAMNITGGSVDPASATYRAVVIKST